MKSKFTFSILLLLAGVLLTSLGAVIGPEQPSMQTQPTLPPGTPIIVPGTPIVIVPDTGDGSMTQTLILFGLLALIVVIVLLVVYLSMSRTNPPPGSPPQ